MRQVLKPLGQLLHRQFGLSLNLQLGQFSEDLTATQGTQHRLPCLEERMRDAEKFFFETGTDGIQHMLQLSQ